MVMVGVLLPILLSVSCITVLVTALAEIVLRLTNRGTVGREMWASLLIGTGIVFLLYLLYALLFAVVR